MMDVTVMGTYVNIQRSNKAKPVKETQEHLGQKGNNSNKNGQDSYAVVLTGMPVTV